MADPIITLTTDFGEASPYVAAMKGVILGINPVARLVDLSHQIPPQNVRHAAHFLALAIPYFPLAAIHVVVVDPGVGSDRPILYVNTGGHQLLVPDNGCWTKLGAAFPDPPAVRRLEAAGFWRQPVSNTFHGRDIFAPVAAHLSLGIDPEKVGPLVTEWGRLPEPRLEEKDGALIGEVDFVDGFGNLITNIPASRCEGLGQPLVVTVGTEVILRRVRTYAEVEPGVLVSLTSSEGMLEIAVNQGNASKRLRAGVGTRVTVEARH
jgi:S-adenosyl-L-methionine hydrolase (adenosine-forming)